MTKPSEGPPREEKGSIVPSGAAGNDLLSLGGKSILELLKLCAGVVLDAKAAGAVSIGGALMSYFAKKYERRAIAFSKETLKATPSVQQLLASEEPPEPLLSTFASVFESCLRDDEDEKVSYYAAFMVGIAEAHLAGALPHLRKVAMLGAIRALRAHELLLFTMLAIGEIVHERFISIKELESYVHAEIKLLRTDFEMAEQAFASLQSHGLIELDQKVSRATVPIPKTYGVTDFGDAFWGVLKDGIQRAFGFQLPTARKSGDH